MATIRERKTKDGPLYQVQVRLKGHPPVNGSFKRKTDANRWAQETEVAIREGRYFKTTQGRKRTLEELINRYLQDCLANRGRDQATVGPQLEWWKQTLGKYVLSDITPMMLAEQRDRLLKEPMSNKGHPKPHRLSNATVLRYLASLSVCFTYGIRDLGWIEQNPVEDVTKPKLPRGRVRFLSPEERVKLLAACQTDVNKALYPVVIIAVSTGARLSEITNLTWKDIDFRRNTMVLEETKNGDRRCVPLPRHVIQLLKEQDKVRRLDTHLLFPRTDGKKPVDLRKPFTRAATAAGLEDFHFHDLRHTAASYLAMSGASLLEIAAILGHKTLSMVQRYAHLTQQHTSNVIERMNEDVFGAFVHLEENVEAG
jgi:integrase